MRKIRLEMEDLAVESFDTAGEGRGRAGGTVHGQARTWYAGCGDPSALSNCATCLEGCPQDTLTCAASCLWTDGNVICKEPYC